MIATAGPPFGFYASSKPRTHNTITPQERLDQLEQAYHALMQEEADDEADAASPRIPLDTEKDLPQSPKKRSWAQTAEIFP